MHSSNRRTGWPSILFAFDEFGGAFQAVDTALMLLFARQAGNDVAGEDNHRWAIELLHGNEGLREFGEESIEQRRISNSIMQPGSCIKADAEFLAHCVGSGVVGVGPPGIFAYEFDIGVAGLGDLGEALRKRQVVPNCPEHDGERKRRMGRGRSLCIVHWFCVQEGAGDCG